jgi:hypothetical protein
VDPEETDKRARAAQKAMVEKHGGENCSWASQKNSSIHRYPRSLNKLKYATLFASGKTGIGRLQPAL